MAEPRIRVTVWRDDVRFELMVPPGANLRQALLDHALTPYAWLTRQLNCGGRGLCATCGVWLAADKAPTHWHDRLARRFGYARLSCQIAVDGPLTVHLDTDKRIWGGRRPRWRDSQGGAT